MNKITSSLKRAISVVIGVITMIVLIALLAVLVVLPGSKQWVDAVAATVMPSTRPLVPRRPENLPPGTYGVGRYWQLRG